MARLQAFLRDDLPHEWVGDKVDYLSDALGAETRIAATDNVSQNTYSTEVTELIDSCRDGLVLDCGTGSRDVYYSNVVMCAILFAVPSKLPAS